MGLILALEASSRTYAVTVGTEDQPRAQRAARRDDPGFAGLGDLVGQAMAAASVAFTDLSMIALDVGPGGLSSIRSAVAYANGLAFSLGVKIFPVSSLELMVLAAQRDHCGPFLSLKRGLVGNTYAGLFVAGEMADLRHGLPNVVVPALAGPLERVCIVGASRDDVADLLPGVALEDAGIADADVVTLYREARASARSDRLVPVASPINEASKLFYEPVVSHRQRG
jgi:tRNA A37 threonylcarbamoyladenosine modification protein TsaB